MKDKFTSTKIGKLQIDIIWWNKGKSFGYYHPLFHLKTKQIATKRILITWS